MRAPRTALIRSRSSRVLVAILIAVVLLTCGGVGFHRWTTRPMGTPGAKDWADTVLSENMTQARVMALGEATHGNAELQELRLQLVQKLPQFRAIAIEEDYGSTRLVDDYLQGGPGTAQEAAARFGFAINNTEQMATLLQWIRDHNAAIDEKERIHMVGIDVQRVDANKQIALDWLTQHDPSAAEALQRRLADWTDGSTVAGGDPTARAAGVEDLVAAIDATSDADAPDRQSAHDAAITLQQNLTLQAAAEYGSTRARLMAENLSRTVAEQENRGNEHTLLFAHNGHVDKSSAAFPYDDLGTLVTQEYGDGYRAIGTEVHRSELISGDGGNRWTVSLNNPTPLRGMFAGTDVGYLEIATASEENRTLLARRVRMTSIGEDFHQWQTWIPWLHSVEMVPQESYDALILVDAATPVTPL